MYFKQQFDFISRYEMSRNIMKKYPDRKPIICEKYKGQGQDLPDIKRKKYLVPNEMTLGDLIILLKNIIGLRKDEAIYLIINGKIYPNSTKIGNIYYAEKDADDLLYIKYLKENTFG